MTRRSVPWVALGLMLCAAMTPARAGEVVFLNDLDEAKALAAGRKAELVIEFSGRKWCPPCKRLLSEVIRTDAFAGFAETRVVVHLDYPPLSERTPEKIAANPALAKLMRIKEAYNVPGFPTVVLLDDRGEEVGRVEGFSDGMTVHEFLAELAGSGKATRAAP